MNRVQVEQVGGGGVTGRVVDLHQVDAGVALEDPEPQPAQAVDADCRRDRGASQGNLDQPLLIEGVLRSTCPRTRASGMGRDRKDGDLALRGAVTPEHPVGAGRAVLGIGL
jgi:hypothetical protein